jgi:hypothetical protein
MAAAVAADCEELYFLTYQNSEEHASVSLFHRSYLTTTVNIQQKHNMKKVSFIEQFHGMTPTDSSPFDFGRIIVPIHRLIIIIILH